MQLRILSSSNQEKFHRKSRQTSNAGVLGQLLRDCPQTHLVFDDFHAGCEAHVASVDFGADAQPPACDDCGVQIDFR